jgi:hypothetical protein
LDLAFGVYMVGQNGGMAVALGNGDGTFGVPQVIPLSSFPYPLLAGDVNGDGNVDLVEMQGQVRTVFLGNGNGTFQALPSSSTAGFTCALADINHDGKLDSLGTYPQLGNGDGTFQDPQNMVDVGNCTAIADFDGDGNLDIASSYNNGFNLSYGNPDGSFQSPVFKWTGIGTAGVGTSPLFAADVNGDGRPDLVTSRGKDAREGGDGDAAVDVLLNKGRNSPWTPVGYLKGTSTFVLGDFNGDHRTDVVVIRRYPPVSGQAIAASVALANPDGTLPLPRSYWVSGSIPSAIIGADFNGDRALDLIEVSVRSLTWRAGRLTRLFGNGDGTFQTQPFLYTGDTGELDTEFASAADMNGDGILDFVSGGGNAVNIRLGLGNGDFQPALTSISNPPFNAGLSRAAIADFNGDGKLDIALNEGNVLLGNGDGTLRLGTPPPIHFSSLVAGDFNGDGKPDLGITTSSSVGILLGNGDGTFQMPLALRPGQIDSLLAGDFNGDGKLDLATLGTTSGGGAVVNVFLGNGDGTLQPARSSWIHGGFFQGATRSAVAADFNHDNHLDLAVNLTSGDVAVLLGDGTGGFSSKSFYPAGDGPLVAGDFDGNGTIDLAVVSSGFSQSGNSVAILLNQP